MLKNYFKIAFRNLRRNNVYSLINIIGLTIGLTGSCMLFMYIQNELSYDAHIKDKERIARVLTTTVEDNRVRTYGRNPSATGEALQNEFGQIEVTTTIYQPFGHLDIHWNGETISERSWFMTDSAFFKVFELNFIEGDPQTALSEPNSIVLTKSMADKYFNEESALGKVMEFERITPMKVTAVVEDQPINSSLKYDILISNNSTFQEYAWWVRGLNSWRFFNSATFVKLTSREAKAEVENQLPAFIERMIPENTRQMGLKFQWLEDIHLNSEDVEFSRTSAAGSWTIIYLFGAVAVFLIMMACINYVNLATSKSMQRAKEIGTRKVSGATRGQLIAQFLSEALLLALISFVLSIFTTDLLMPYFNQLTGVELKIEDQIYQTIGLLLVLTLGVGVLSGSYPAFYLSSLKPTDSLKGGGTAGAKSAALRKGLVILQFTLSIFMISSTLIIGRQMDYVMSKDLGYQKENILVIDINDRNVRENFQAMKLDYASINGVTSVATSSRVPGEWKNINEVFVKNQQKQSDSTQTYFMCFDEDMLETFQLSLLDGRNFSGNLAEDSTQVLINESAAALIEGNPIGANIFISGADQSFKVIGVLKDFNYQSLHQDVAPLVIGNWYNPVTSIDYFSIGLAPGVDMKQILQEAEFVHKKFDKSTAMEYHFIDEQLQLFYTAEKQAGLVFSIGSVLTIIIACMGLFGMASFIVQKRTKEIGIRKVLGASKWGLFVLLSRAFVIQVVVAFIIATPFTWYIMQGWLEGFAYAANPGLGQYLIAGFMAITVAVISVSYRVLKTAGINPAETLKTE
ncbi:ABC transporter permease [Fulvivirga lutimaris]|uniref:ABC transporter permease n=1 Tax=Fulvivirga lutimaris TaxID=1819566 RepID=UPI0012BD75CD|nr:ABC transporter permease [Fulvivirga lutimaris]MTI40399.1 ABC transporter permease [Fulvivirga lutimaris]